MTMVRMRRFTLQTSGDPARETSSVTSSCSRAHVRTRLAVILTSVALVAAASVAMTQGGASAATQLVTQPAPSSQFSAWQPVGQTVQLDPQTTGITNTAESSNWSGYADTGPTFSAISAQWVVPTVQPSQSSQYSSTWIGIDGYGDSSLIQTGTAQETSSGATDYYDWYEILPAYAVVIGSVTPGDHMTASVQEVTAGTWTIAITDITSGSVFSQQFAYSGAASSAEWIEEAPTINGVQSTLADFGSASFSGVADSNSGSTSVTQNPIDMINSSHSIIASPGSVVNNAFTVTYDGPVPTPPVVQSTTTTVSVSPASSISGNAVTYAASVTSASGTPTGTVTFTDGTTTLCTTGALVSGSASCRTSSAPEGTDTITGTYSGSAGFDASSGTATLVVSAPTISAPTPTPTPTPTPSSQHGYWLVGSDGGIFSFGSAQFYGSTGAMTLQRPVVGITPTADDGGYWLVAADGGIFSFNAGFYGSIPGLGLAPAGSANPKRLNAPIVGMVPSADGGGYFMVASDGGVFAFGDAKFEGSCPGIGGCSGAAVAVMPDVSGNGYWLVTATGHVYAFGDAVNYGAPGPQAVSVTSAVRTKDGAGYWLLFSNGVVAPYGDAANLGGPTGSVGGLNPANAIFTTSDGGGYWVASASGAVYTYGDAPNDGSMAGQHLNGSIIAATGW
jgi:hypothetical protein